MAKSLVEQIDQIRRKEERAAQAAKEAKEEMARVIAPIAEKVSSAVKTRLEEVLKGDITLATEIDLSREAIRDAVDAFVAGMTGKKEKAKAAKKAAVQPSAPAPVVPEAVALEA